MKGSVKEQEIILTVLTVRMGKLRQSLHYLERVLQNFAIFINLE